MWHYSANLDALEGAPSAAATVDGSRERRARVGKILGRARAEGRMLLTEYESKRVLSFYGIPVVRTKIAHSETEAVAQAGRMGFPVVVKLLSATLTHKKAAGGVRLGIRNAAGVRVAWREIKRTVTSRGAADDFLGVTVQPEIAPEGCELILGSSIDAQVGPVILFGAGGEFVEVFRDYALGLPPLNAAWARRLMERTRIHAWLSGRSGSGANLATLERQLVAFSQLVIEQPWIKEIDVNPLRALPDRIVALDARMVLHPGELTRAKLPRPAFARVNFRRTIGKRCGAAERQET